jgi:hypothetical protein
MSVTCNRMFERRPEQRSSESDNNQLSVINYQ